MNNVEYYSNEFNAFLSLSYIFGTPLIANAVGLACGNQLGKAVRKIFVIKSDTPTTNTIKNICYYTCRAFQAITLTGSTSIWPLVAIDPRLKDHTDVIAYYLISTFAIATFGETAAQLFKPN